MNKPHNGDRRRSRSHPSIGQTENVSRARAFVFVIDDDPAMRDSLRSLIRSVGLQVDTFASTQDFLQHDPEDAPSCLVLDVRLPGRSGLDFQQQLALSNIHIPIIFITGHGDIPMSVRAMKAGAVEFLTKPFRDQDLLDAIQLALEKDRDRRRREQDLESLRRRFETLTPRERQVLPLVVSGRLNKQIASELGTSEITVKVHRASIMRKMQAASVADLVRAAGELGIPKRQ
jgi:FixJ family two-component response regulator